MIDRFKHYIVGVEAMDVEHLELAECIERLGRSKDTSESSSTIDDLMRKWLDHHEHEERLMKEFGYPYCKYHFEQHANISYDFKRLQTKIGSRYTFDETIAMLATDALELLLAHIDHHDREFAQWIAIKT